MLHTEIREIWGSRFGGKDQEHNFLIVIKISISKKKFLYPNIIKIDAYFLPVLS